MTDRGNVDSLNVTYVFNVEKTYDMRMFDSYMLNHWSDSFVYSAVYLIFIFLGKEYMRKQKHGYALRPYLVAWSSLLAIFSIIAALRTFPFHVSELWRVGLEYTCCDPSYWQAGTIVSFWGMLFTVSKVVELGDTLFIVLRKQPLIVLHWYHHVTVLIYSWYSYSQHITTAHWFMGMNYFVHSFMYTYYALRAMRFRLPRWVSMCLTALQLTQMLMGIVVIVVAYMALNAGRRCQNNYTNIACGIVMYFSYLVLFVQFFYTSYVKKPVSEDKKSI